MARLTPHSLLLALGTLAGSLGYLLDRRHTRIAMENLRMAFGAGLSPREARRIVRACWHHFGRITMDTLSFARLGRESAARRVQFEGLEHLRAAYERGRGVLVFTGHFGHWELAGVMQGHLGLPLAVVARPLDNPRLERMLAALRTGSGNRVIHKRNAVREIMKTLREKIGVAIVIDQDARGDGIFVPFFGRLASTTPTLALLALRTGAEIIPCSCRPEPDGSCTVVYGPPVEARDSGDREADLLRITAECTSVIESWVRERPELWLWMHRRWKTRPAEESAGGRPAQARVPFRTPEG
jgi:KDO2-lipid IV(A) lauroyltransferase